MVQKFNKEQVWNEVLASLKVSVSPAIYQTWFLNTHLVSLKKVSPERYLAEIGCTSGFIKATVEKRYFGLTQDALMQVLGSPSDLIFSVKLPQPPKNINQNAVPLFDDDQTNDIIMERVVKARINPGFKPDGICCN